MSTPAKWGRTVTPEAEYHRHVPADCTQLPAKPCPGCGTPIGISADVCLSCEAADAWSEETALPRPRYPRVDPVPGGSMIRDEDDWGRPVTRYVSREEYNGDR